MDKKLGELGSKLWGAIESRFVELEKKMDEKMELMEERLMGKLEIEWTRRWRS